LRKNKTVSKTRDERHLARRDDSGLAFVSGLNYKKYGLTNIYRNIWVSLKLNTFVIRNSEICPAKPKRVD